MFFLNNENKISIVNYGGRKALTKFKFDYK